MGDWAQGQKLIDSRLTGNWILNSWLLFLFFLKHKLWSLVANSPRISLITENIGLESNLKIAPYGSGVEGSAASWWDWDITNHGARLSGAPSVGFLLSCCSLFLWLRFLAALSHPSARTLCLAAGPGLAKHGLNPLKPGAKINGFFLKKKKVVFQVF